MRAALQIRAWPAARASVAQVGFAIQEVEPPLPRAVLALQSLSLCRSNSAEGVPLPRYAQIRGAVGHQLLTVGSLFMGPRRIGRRAPGSMTRIRQPPFPQDDPLTRRQPVGQLLGHIRRCRPPAGASWNRTRHATGGHGRRGWALVWSTRYRQVYVGRCSRLGRVCRRTSACA